MQPSKGEMVAWKQDGQVMVGQVEELWASAVLVRRLDGAYLAPTIFAMRRATADDLARASENT